MNKVERIVLEKILDYCLEIDERTSEKNEKRMEHERTRIKTASMKIRELVNALQENDDNQKVSEF